MNRVKDTFSRFGTRVRSLAKRKRGRDADDGEDGGKKPKSTGRGVALRLIPLSCALAASAVSLAVLAQCEYGAYAVPHLGPSACESWRRNLAFMSTSAGVGFLVFLTMEVAAMIFAQMWKDRQIDRSERQAEFAQRQVESAERRAESAERQAESAERRAEMAEQARREDAERAERMVAMMEQARREDAERAERRESLLIELVESLKNRKNGAAE